MLIALELAEKGLGEVEPNPAVGCVIVKDGEIIGRGWHERFGEGHAEIRAMEDCKENGCDPAGATMYVTLEPCCHYGKTGPCSKAIIEAGVGKVVPLTKTTDRCWDDTMDINLKGAFLFARETAPHMIRRKRCLS